MEGGEVCGGGAIIFEEDIDEWIVRGEREWLDGMSHQGDEERLLEERSDELLLGVFVVET